MKILKIKTISFFLASCLIAFVSNAQSPFTFITGSTNSYEFDQSLSFIPTRIGFGNFPNGTNLTSIIHVDGNSLGLNNTGEVFRTDAPNIATYWRMLRGTNEYGVLYNNNDNHFYLQATNANGSMIFNTSLNAERMRIYDANFTNTAGAADPGMVRIGFSATGPTPNGFGPLLNLPKLLVVGSVMNITTAFHNYTVAEFRSEHDIRSSVGIKIRGSREFLTHLCTSHIDFSNFDFDEGASGTEFQMVRLAADMQMSTGQMGFFRIFTRDNSTTFQSKVLIDNVGFTGIGVAFDMLPGGVFNGPMRRLHVDDPANAPQFRISHTYNSTLLSGVFTDFQTLSTGDLVINPQNASTGRFVGIANTGVFTAATPPQRKLEVRDASNDQLRLSYNTIASTDFFTDNSGWLTINPNGFRTKINGGSIGGPATPQRGLDVFGDVRIRTLNVDNTLTSVIVANSSGDLFQNNSLLPLANNAWMLAGNTLTSGNEYIGTNNAYDWVIKTTNLERMRVLGITQGASILPGNVGIGTTAPIARLHVQDDYILGVTPEVAGAFIMRNSYYDSNNLSFYGVQSLCAINNLSGVAYTKNFGGEFFADGGNENYGVKGIVTGQSQNPFIRNYAVFGEAGGAGFNWAGWFNGFVFSTDIYQGSDSALKQNEVVITNASEILDQVTPISFEFVQNTSLNLPTGTQFGFSAQEVEDVLPTLVKDAFQPAKYDTAGNLIADSISFKAVNYIGFIPILWATVQNQQTNITQLQNQLNDLQSVVSECCGIEFRQINPNGNGQGSSSVNNQNVELKSVNRPASLGANIPNPFDGTTTIPYYLPEHITDGNAIIIFSDKHGRVIQQVPIVGRGEGQLTVLGSKLAAGVYSYSLIVDGETVDTKQMVKVK